MSEVKQGQAEGQPATWRFVVGFLLVGMAWGLTTPFMRRAAVKQDREQTQSTERKVLHDPRVGVITKKFYAVLYAVIDLLRRPAYAIPLVINLSGSVWFFLLLGKAEISLMVPITNSLAFLFTVLGEWYAEGKVISRDTWLGIGLVLGGIALCVTSKNT